jgi:hypothetical protein
MVIGDAERDVVIAKQIEDVVRRDFSIVKNEARRSRSFSNCGGS